jgi:hypothetical protein
MLKHKNVGIKRHPPKDSFKMGKIESTTNFSKNNNS